MRCGSAVIPTGVSHATLLRTTRATRAAGLRRATTAWMESPGASTLRRRGAPTVGLHEVGGVVARGLGSDGMGQAEVPVLERIQPGGVTRLFTPGELDVVLEAIKDKVVVLQCKAKTCRPCMAFARKFSRLAESYPDITFFEMFGDESKATRKLMMDFGVKATPTFRVYMNGELKEREVGINEKKVRKAILAPAGLWEEEEEEEEEEGAKKQEGSEKPVDQPKVQTETGPEKAPL